MDQAIYLTSASEKLRDSLAALSLGPFNALMT